MMRIGRVLGGSLAAVALAVTLLGLPGAVTTAQPLPPNRFFGRATVDGQPAGGATINALIGGTTCGSATADGSGNYRLDVLSSGERPGCGTDGATVTFTVAGQRASQTATWKQGEFTSLDLTAARAQATATTAPPATATATTAPPVGTATATATAPAATATATAVPALPRTGTGGGDHGWTWLALALAGLAVASVGSLLALRRLRQ